MLFLFLVAIFCYIGGYRLDNVRANVVVPEFFRQNIRVPRFIFLICASPKSKRYPSGIMLTSGLINQLIGIGVAIYAIVFFVFAGALDYLGLFEVVIEMVSLGLILAVSYFIPYWLSKKYPYNA